MSIILDGTTGITTPGLTNTGTETILNLTTTGNTILGDATTDTLNVGAGGLVKDASGNVGIGTASPSAPLDVRGTSGLIRTSSTTGTNTTNIGFTNSGGSFYVGLDNSTGGNFGAGNYGALLYNGANTPMVFFTNATEKMRLDSSGNLGLGVTPNTWNIGKAIQLGTLGALWSQSYVTYVLANAYYNAGYKYVGTGAVSIYEAGGGSHVWYSAGSGTAGNAISLTQAMTLDASGNLGIGTSSPSRRLHVVDSGSFVANFQSSGTGIYTSWQASGGTVGYIGGAAGLGAGSATDFGIRSETNMVFMTNAGTERMRIDSSGNVLFGTTGVPNGTSVYGSAFVPISYGRSRLAMATSDTGDLQIVQFFNPNGQVGAINTNSSETDYYTTSSSTTGAVLVRNGVQFPASQVASSNANTLDDYEEGTWTPVLAGSSSTSGQTYLTQSGKYTKIGRVVTLTALVELSNKGTMTGTYVNLTGFPFALMAGGSSAGSVGYWSALNSASFLCVGLYADSSVSYGYMTAGKTTAANIQYLSPTDITNNTAFILSITYQTAT